MEGKDRGGRRAENNFVGIATIARIAMRLTQAHIEAGRTGPGGWSRKQLETFGVPWPPPSGWKASLEGKEVSEEVFLRFLLSRRNSR